MKKVRYILISILFFTIAFSFNSFGQCKDFAKKICKKELSPYIHDGNFNAMIFNEGEVAEMFKAFYAGQEYRINICADEELGNIEFKILDSERKVIFDNKDFDYAQKWDFRLETSQQLIVSIKVPINQDPEKSDVKSGCVAVLFGFLNE